MGGGAHQTAETVDMARLAEPPALPLLPQGYPLTISCPASAHRSLCADKLSTLVSHGFYLKLDVCKHFDGGEVPPSSDGSPSHLSSESSCERQERNV